MVDAGGVIGTQARQRRVFRDSSFFLPAALIQLVVVVWGFGPTFFWAVATPPPHPTMLTDRGAVAHAIFLAHGLVFTAWMLLYCVQSGLVSARRIALHRRLGLSAAILVPLVVLLGLAASFEGLLAGFHVHSIPSAAFFAIPLFAALNFGAFAWVGLAQRRDPAAHKRWMLLATLVLTSAGTARIDVINAMFPEWFDATSFLLVALALWDVATKRRPHPVTLWGGIIFLIIDMGSLPLGMTDGWLTLMKNITS